MSVHLGVHGRITSNTPNVAQTVTNNSARIRHSQMIHGLGLVAEEEPFAPAAGPVPIKGESGF
ncbi:MAG TPA: hypothetical protein VJ731_03915 [Terriglobales bacterium]|nr:hypothetical protein [Terriglobales bacterium]